MTSKQIDSDDSANNAPKPGIYKHYKGKLYQVLGSARHSETEEWLVVYQALYGEKGYWLRPLSIWLEPVKVTSNHGETPKIVERFQFIDSNDTSLDALTQHS